MANGKSTNGISVGSLVGDILCCIAAEILESASLNDGEERLFVAIEWGSLREPLYASVKPTLSHQQALLCILIIALARRTLVECHDDVGSNDTLCLHDVFGGEDVFRTVDMRSELTSFLA